MDLILREEIERLTEEETIPRVYRDRSCPFETIDDESFRRRFRFTRAGFFRIVDQMRADLERSTNRAMPLTTAQQLAITIRVLASRSFQLNAGDSFGVAQSTVSRVVASVSDWFHQNSERFVKWHDERSRNEMQYRVFHNTGLPGVVGAIDGTHIAIPKPGDAQYSYINRKDFASINMGAIVDDNYRFLWFSARWPGRAHDSRVWRESQLYQRFVRRELKGRIVGDSAYRAEPFLIKIVNSRNPTRSQAAYNKAICRFRAHVEQAFGHLKRQFHALQAGLRYRPLRASRLIATAVCLRNAAITFREPDPYDDEGIEIEWEDDIEDGPDPDLNSGRNVINAIVENYFRR